MKFVNKVIFTSILSAVTAYGIGEPLQAPEDLSKAKENILAGTVGKKESPVVGVQQENLNMDGNNENDSLENQDSKNTKKKNSKIVTKSKKPAYNYKNEKILNWINLTNADIAGDNNPQAKVRPISFKGVLADKNLSKNTLQASINDASNLMKQKDSRVTGICTIPEEVDIAANSKAVLTAYCSTSNGKYKLFGELVPNAEQYSLFAKAIYIENTYGQRLYVDHNESYVLNSKKNNQNVATFVNTYALDKVMRESIKSGTKRISAAGTDYMEAVKASRTTQETVMVPNAGTTTSTNTAKPVVSDYLNILGIQMSSELIEKWADYAMQDHPWGFKILANTKIYIDLSVKGVE
jgi:hypothetical protein